MGTSMYFEAVDVHELVGLGERGAGHTGKLFIHAKIILEGDRGERLILGLDWLVLFGFQRLMQTFRITAPRHHAASEFVDNDDFAVPHDVILVTLKQLVRAQRLVDVVDDGHVLDVVERFALELAGGAQPLLKLSMPASVNVTVRCFSSTS